MAQSVNPEEAAISQVSGEIDGIVDSLAQTEGPAIGSHAVSDDKLLQQWGTRDPKILDPAGMKAQLMQGGLPPEMLDPKSPNALALIKARPDLAQVLANPLDEKMADMMSRLAEFPLRLSILAPFEQDPKGAVDLANRLDRQWQKLPSAQPLPSPPPATPATGAVPTQQPDQATTLPVPPGAPAAIAPLPASPPPAQPMLPLPGPLAGQQQGNNGPPAGQPTMGPGA